MPSESDALAPPETAAAPRSVEVRIGGKSHTVAYQTGDSILESVRRAGLKAPFSCQQGNCATCIAFLDAGSVTMRHNNALSADEVEEGWVLTCQSVPTSSDVTIDYDR